MVPPEPGCSRPARDLVTDTSGPTRDAVEDTAGVSERWWMVKIGKRLENDWTSKDDYTEAGGESEPQDQHALVSVDQYERGQISHQGNG